MKVYGFTLPQLEYYRTFCNFSPDEKQLFDLRAEGKSLEECAEIMHRDNVKKLSVRVNNKMIQVTDKKCMENWIEKIYWKMVLNHERTN